MQSNRDRIVALDIGKFLSPDRVRDDETNGVRYVRNSFPNAGDPSGQEYEMLPNPRGVDAAANSSVSVRSQGKYLLVDVEVEWAPQYHDHVAPTLATWVDQVKGEALMMTGRAVEYQRQWEESIRQRSESEYRKYKAVSDQLARQRTLEEWENLPSKNRPFNYSFILRSARLQRANELADAYSRRLRAESGFKFAEINPDEIVGYGPFGIPLYANGESGLTRFVSRNARDAAKIGLYLAEKTAYHLEVGMGMLLLAVPEGTFTKVLGVAMIAHGSDNLIAQRLNDVQFRDPSRPLYRPVTAAAISKIATSLGADEESAIRIGDNGNIIIGVALPAGPGAVKIFRWFAGADLLVPGSLAAEASAAHRFSQLSIARANSTALADMAELEAYGTLIANNPVAAALHRRLIQNGYQHILDFGPVLYTDDGLAILGTHSRFPRKITVFVRGHEDGAAVLGTFGHEARHGVDRLRGLPLDTRWSEFRAHLQDFTLKNGRVPNASEVQDLAIKILRDYRDLPADKMDSLLRQIAVTGGGN